MLIIKSRHGKRYTHTTLANGEATYTSTTYTDVMGIIATISVDTDDYINGSDVSEAIQVSLTEEELRALLKGIENYKKHFNADGTVK